MPNSLPVILIGGPPHAGKSVLFYSLTHALRAREIRHHAFRACPDGEGNWTQESDPDTVSRIRLKVSGPWSQQYRQLIAQSLEHRCLPLIIDMGGKPTDADQDIQRLCTHAILLSREDNPESTQTWIRVVKSNAIMLMGHAYSELKGESRLTKKVPVIEGNLTGLVRGKNTMVQGPVFDALVERIAALFSSYSPDDLEREHFAQAPGELLNLYDIVPPSERWQPHMLPDLLPYLPRQVPLSVHGVAPWWVYAAIAGASDNPSFYLFDPKFGWIRPVALQCSGAIHPDIEVQVTLGVSYTGLKINIPSKRLDYFQSAPIPFPAVDIERGIVLSGSSPYWLVTAMIRFYRDMGVAWIACYYPPIERGIIVYTRVETKRIGEQIIVDI